MASSHIRIGTFQFFAARNDHQALKTLCDYTIERHYPELKEEGPNQYIGLIDKVSERQIQLVAKWMRVGFIHGVMNTDNTALSGETIDYGPCAMMGIYNPQTVYSSVDTMGRYAFGNQPKIAQWNLTRFAECLLPLINADPNKAMDQVGPIITEFPDRFIQVYMQILGKKLGLTSFRQEDQKLLFSILNRLKERNMDYTIIFDLLTKSLLSEAVTSQVKNELEESFDLWQKRLREQHASPQEVQDLMGQHNPVVIPRNHHVEAAVQECEQNGEVALAENFLQVLRSPYKELAGTSQYQDPPRDGDANYQTFCGT